MHPAAAATRASRLTRACKRRRPSRRRASAQRLLKRGSTGGPPPGSAVGVGVDGRGGVVTWLIAEPSPVERRAPEARPAEVVRSPALIVRQRSPGRSTRSQHRDQLAHVSAYSTSCSGFDALMASATSLPADPGQGFFTGWVNTGHHDQVGTLERIGEITPRAMPSGCSGVVGTRPPRVPSGRCGRWPEWPGPCRGCARSRRCR